MDSNVKSTAEIFNPEIYVCTKAAEKPVIDGDIYKPFWQNVPFSKLFLDIEGREKPEPRFDTRMKMQWDNEYLYIAAELFGNEIWGHVTERDDVIFADNDFEIFIDPDSDTHCYLEFEMNARNTVWDLLLTKPYRDGGFAVNGWDFKNLRTAVKINGELNNTQADNVSWTVEIALPIQSVLEVSKNNEPITDGVYWRINFSRVQWTVDVVGGQYVKRLDPSTGKPLPEDNWVWSPQGVINMHCPEMWGFLFFSEKGGEYHIPDDERIKWELRHLYYAQRDHFDSTGTFTTDVNILFGDRKYTIQPIVEVTKNAFEIRCPDSDGTGEISIFTDGRIAIGKATSL